jgi:hypothetical protein
MQTRTYGDLYKLIQSLAGVKSFAPSEEDDIANFINRRFFTAYSTTNAWPRYLVNSEERTVNSFKLLGPALANIGTKIDNSYWYHVGDDANKNAVYYPSNVGIFNEFVVRKNTDKKWEILYIVSNSISISEEGVVTYTDGTIQMRQTDTPERDNPWDVKKWTYLTDDYSGFARMERSNTVNFTEDYFDSTFSSGYSGGKTQKQQIGEFIRIYAGVANRSNSVIEYNFFVEEDGANVLNVNTNNVFVTYKIPFTKFEVISSFSNSSIPVPEEFFSYIAHGAYADFLTMDGQTSKAIVESERADEHLNLQLEKVDIMNNNNIPNTKFSTYVNKQSR